MKQLLKQFLGIAVGLALVLASVPPALAAESIAASAALKGLRGLQNIAFGFVTEWPKTIYYESVDHGLPYGLTVGAVKGVGWGTLRTGVGVYELATFPVPVPSQYKPMLYPAFPYELTERTH